jgi:hypothetical protein
VRESTQIDRQRTQHHTPKAKEKRGHQKNKIKIGRKTGLPKGPTTITRELWIPL